MTAEPTSALRGVTPEILATQHHAHRNPVAPNSNSYTAHGHARGNRMLDTEDTSPTAQTHTNISPRHGKRGHTAYFPPLQKFAAVMRLHPSDPTSFQSATFFSGMFHKRILQSSEPLRKYLSLRGWNAMAVTKSSWRKHARHSDRDTCHRRTVLSIDDESRKTFLE